MIRPQLRRSPAHLSKKSARARPRVPPRRSMCPHAPRFRSKKSFPLSSPAPRTPATRSSAPRGTRSTTRAGPGGASRARTSWTRWARRATSSHAAPRGEARFLDAFSRAGVAFADGRNAEAWQLLTRALQEAGPAASSRTLSFVEDEVRALGPNPGPDANWVMGLAFADVRGDLEGELAKAEERAPRSPRVREARELAEGR